MKENILILVNSFISCSKKQYFKTQLINTEHRTQNTDTEHRTQTQLISGLAPELSVMTDDFTVLIVTIWHGQS